MTAFPDSSGPDPERPIALLRGTERLPALYEMKEIPTSYGGDGPG